MSPIYKSNGNRIVLTDSRLSYVFLTPGKPDVDDKGNEKYKASIMMPMDAFKKQKKYIDAAIKATIDVGVKKRLFKRVLAEKALKGENVGFRLPYYNKGELMEMGQHKMEEALMNTMGFSAWNKSMPRLTGMQKVPAEGKYEGRPPQDRPFEPLDPEEIYSGVWARCAVHFFPYNKKTVGIGVTLDGVMKVKDDEPLDGTLSDVAVFEDVEVADAESGDLE